MGTALIVEDDPEWVDVYIKILKQTPYQNHEISSDLESALRNVRKNSFGLYICDGDFPMNSRELAKDGTFFIFYEELRRIHPKPNLVLLSAGEENIRKGKEMGLDCYEKGSSMNFDDLLARLKVAP